MATHAHTGREVSVGSMRFLSGLVLFLLAAGCLLDIFSAIVVLVPLITPVAAVYGVDPLHLGIEKPRHPVPLGRYLACSQHQSTGDQPHHRRRDGQVVGDAAHPQIGECRQSDVQSDCHDEYLC